MNGPLGGSRYLNNSIFPNQLFTAIPTENNGVPCALITVPTSGLDVYLHRIVLQTTLAATDLVGGNGGQYWNLKASPPVQAPFYLFMSSLSPSNLIDLSLIGSVNVGEYVHSIQIPQNTNVFGLWRGVLPGSAAKCQATLSVSGNP